MIIKAAIAISIASTILLIQPVLAEDSTTSSTTRIPTNIQKRIDTSGADRTRMEKSKQMMEQKQLSEASRAAMFRRKLEDIRAKIASREAEMRLKFQQFKDKQKATIAERVNTSLNKINQNQTDQMLKHLDLMSTLLDKLEDRVNKNSSDIKDPAAANQAIADARATIDAAKTAVQAQAQKDYTIQVTTETKIRLDAQAKRDQLHKDIMALRKQVIDAKQKVSDAVRIAKSGSKEATTSGQH